MPLPQPLSIPVAGGQWPVADGQNPPAPKWCFPFFVPHLQPACNNCVCSQMVRVRVRVRVRKKNNNEPTVEMQKLLPQLQNHFDWEGGMPHHPPPPSCCCCCCVAAVVELRCTAAFKTVCQSFFHIIDCLLDYKPRHWLSALLFFCVSHFIPLVARATLCLPISVMFCQQQHCNQQQQTNKKEYKTKIKRQQHRGRSSASVAICAPENRQHHFILAKYFGTALAYFLRPATIKDAWFITFPKTIEPMCVCVCRIAGWIKDIHKK